MQQLFQNMNSSSQNPVTSQQLQQSLTQMSQQQKMDQPPLHQMKPSDSEKQDNMFNYRQRGPEKGTGNLGQNFWSAPSD